MAESRQRLWQLKQRAGGRCQQCGAPSGGKSRCDACAVKYGGVLRRSFTVAQWDVVNWARRDNAIASGMGVTGAAVGYQRRRRGMVRVPKTEGGHG